MRLPTLALLALLASAVLGASTPQAPANSRLWGKAGEKWSPKGRLLDYSYAGYRFGAPLPRPKVVANAASHGARGDGKTDDTDAIQAAIDAASHVPGGGTVFLPPGTYVVSKPIGIRSSGVVLRGAGPAKTRIYIRQSLSDVLEADSKPDPCTGEMKSGFSFGGGFLSILGVNAGVGDTQNFLTGVTKNSQRGDRRLWVNTTAGIKAGDTVRLFMYDEPAPEEEVGVEGNVVCKGGKWVSAAAVEEAPQSGTAAVLAAMLPYMRAASADLSEEDGVGAEAGAAAAQRGRPGRRSLRRALLAEKGSLVADLYGNMEKTLPGPESLFKEQGRFASRVAAVGDGWVELERPLPYNVHTEWHAQLHRYNATVQDSGIQDLSIKFKWTEYAGHLKERGYNGIAVDGVAHCWVSNVEIINADSGVFATVADWVTIDRVTVSVERQRFRHRHNHEWVTFNGHHAIMHTASQDGLVSRFNIKDRYYHDLTTEGYSLGMVFASGSGVDLNMDMHRRGPYATLFTDINVGLGSRPFESSGRGDRGAHSASFSTWWNIRSQDGRPVVLPDCDFGPQLNFVGAFTGNSCPGMKWSVESLGTRLQPKNLLDAMRSTRAKRLGLKAGPPPAPPAPPPAPLPPPPAPPAPPQAVYRVRPKH